MLLLFPFAQGANGRQGWGRRAGPAPAGRRAGEKGRARSRLQALPLALATAPVSGDVTGKQRVALLRSRLPFTARGSALGGAGPAAAATHQAEKRRCPELLPQPLAAPTAARGRTCWGRRRGKAARNLPASRGALPRAFPFAPGEGPRRLPPRRPTSPERPLRREARPPHEGTRAGRPARRARPLSPGHQDRSRLQDFPSQPSSAAGYKFELYCRHGHYFLPVELITEVSVHPRG